MISIPAEPQPGALALTAHIEALLFVAAEALTLDALVAALLASDAQVRAALGELASQCAGRGVRLQHYGEAYTLVSAPEAAAAGARAALGGGARDAGDHRVPSAAHTCARRSGAWRRLWWGHLGVAGARVDHRSWAT